MSSVVSPGVDGRGQEVGLVEPLLGVWRQRPQKLRRSKQQDQCLLKLAQSMSRWKQRRTGGWLVPCLCCLIPCLCCQRDTKWARLSNRCVLSWPRNGSDRQVMKHTTLKRRCIIRRLRLMFPVDDSLLAVVFRTAACWLALPALKFSVLFEVPDFST